MQKLTLLLALTVGVGTFASGCGDTEPVIDESLVTDPAFFFDRGVTTLKSPNSKTGEVDYAAAYSDFTRAAELGADNPKTHFNAGWTAERLGQTSNAEKHYRASLGADAGYSSALFNLAALLTGSERYDEAAAIYRSYLEAKPDDLDVHNSLVDSLTRSGQHEDALAEARLILQKDPANVEAFRNLSRTYFAMGEYGMSQLCSEKARSLKDGDPGIYNNLGVTNLQQGDLPAAIEQFKTAIKIDPDNVEANLNLGYVALDSGDYALALTCFTAATTASPENVDGLLGLAVSQRGVKDYESAARTYDRIIEMDPQNQLVYFNAATLHEKYTKDFKRAKQMLQAYVDANQGSVSPDHEVFARIDRIDESERLESERLAAIELQKKEAKEREDRQRAQLTELASRMLGYNKKMEAANCPAVVEMGMLEDFQMIGEQGQMVVDAEDFAMAGDMITFIDQMEPMLDEMVGMCGDGGGEPAPEEAPVEEAPANDVPADAPADAPTEEAPVEEAPAEPVEEAPAEPAE